MSKCYVWPCGTCCPQDDFNYEQDWSYMSDDYSLQDCKCEEPMKEIFVFGSNRAGVHGAGAAKTAYNCYGAKIGVGEGLEGDSYAIPTKDHDILTLPIEDIQEHVNTFIEFAKQNNDKTFKVTAIGTGLAGYDIEDIAPLFKNAPTNCIFDARFAKILGKGYKYFTY